MGTYRKAEDLVRAQLARAQQVRRSLTIETEQLVEQSRKDAVQLTSGNVSSATLRREGHPFARKPAARPGLKGGQRGSRPRLPINRQGGDLQQSLRVIPQRRGMGSRWLRIQFMSGHARYVLAPGGTGRMVARGFWAEMRRRSEQRRKRSAAALRRANRG